MTGRPLEDIQDEILDALHGGEPIHREAILARHPEHAEALRRFFQLIAVIETPAEPKPAEPSRLGEFEIIREIGRGGMGVVYEARQVSLNRRVALKVLPPAMRSDRRLLARFQREAEAAARLRHPNIVPVYSIGESAGAPFFAMELVEGRSLAEIIKLRKAGDDAGLPQAGADYRRWAVATVARIADALDYAHGRGILHRDIKPGNILIEADGTPRLTDFGLALDLQASELTQTGEMFGSPLYMSPEQAFRREQPVDARTDIYSLAVTLYELLMLRLPYHGSTHAELMAALSSGTIIAPRLADPDCPEPLERVLVQALQSEPHDRYGTAGAFAVDLRAALDRPQDVRAVVAPVGGKLPAPAAAPAQPAPAPPRRVLIGFSLRGWRAYVGLGLIVLAIIIALDGGEAPAVFVIGLLGAVLLIWAQRRRGKAPPPEAPPPAAASPPAAPPPEREGRYRGWRRERPIFSGMTMGCGCLLMFLFGLALFAAFITSGRDQRRDAWVTTHSDHHVAWDADPASTGFWLEDFRTKALPYDLSADAARPGRPLSGPREERRAQYPSPVWPPLLTSSRSEVPEVSEFLAADGNGSIEADAPAIVIEGPLGDRYVARSPQWLLCPEGISEAGDVTLEGACTALVEGEMAGHCRFEDDATLIVDGDLSGEVEIRAVSDLSALVLGDLTGRIVGRGQCLLYIEGRLLGDLELEAPSKVFIAHLESADLDRIHATAPIEILVRHSDLEPGTYRFGDSQQLVVTVAP